MAFQATQLPVPALPELPGWNVSQNDNFSEPKVMERFDCPTNHGEELSKGLSALTTVDRGVEVWPGAFASFVGTKEGGAAGGPSRKKRERRKKGGERKEKGKRQETEWLRHDRKDWIPAFAGMTTRKVK